MNRTSLCKSWRFAVQYLKSPCFHDRIIQQRYLANRLLPVNLNSIISKNQCRFIFRSTPISSKSNEDSKDVPHDVLDNEDFQNILKDFSKDFGVGSESEKILEDIKKSLNKPDSKDESSSLDSKKEAVSPKQNIDPHTALKNKFKEFSDGDAVVFHSYEDFVAGKYYEGELLYHVDHELDHEELPEDVKRGITGVFDIHELVDALKREKVTDIAVISVPEEYHYADYLVLTTARSARHSKAAVENIMKLFKRKKSEKDQFAIVEGEKVADWKAIDMGNIVLHVFLEETRAFYDIESLWLFDTEFDSGGTMKPDPIYEAMEEQMAFFNSLQDSPSVQEKELPKETT